MNSRVLPALATLAEFRTARLAQRQRPFLWFRPCTDGRWWTMRLTPSEAAKVNDGCIMRLCRHELAARAALVVWDGEIAAPPTALINGAYLASVKLLHHVTQHA